MPAKKAIMCHFVFKELSEKIVSKGLNKYWMVKNTLYGAVMAVDVHIFYLFSRYQLDTPTKICQRF